MYELIGIYGASGFGSEVLPLVQSEWANTRIVFIDDKPELTTFCDTPVFSYDEFVSQNSTKGVVIAIANSAVRKKITETLIENKIDQVSVKAQNTVVLGRVEVDKGAILSPFTCFTSNIKIGKCFHANIYSYIGHDCVIGDYVTFAPGVKCNGNVHIEDHAYIGTGAIIKQGTPKKPLVIGAGAIVGMGAVVTKSVAPGLTVIGNPARPLTKESLRQKE